MTQPDDSTAETRFGAYVKQVREARGWTQEFLRRQLADQFSVELSSTAMARLEQGKRPIRFNEVAALAKLFGLDLREYGSVIPRLTEDEYRKAVHEVEKIRTAERALREKLARMRQTRDDDISQTERDIVSWQEQRRRLEDAIRDYEGRQGG